MFEQLVEQRIEEAQARGEFEHLPGAGRPIDLEADPLVPEDLRVAWRVLKNAGFVPPEVEHLRAAATEVEGARDDVTRARALRKLQALSLALAESRPGGRRGLAAEPRYYARILSKLA